MHPRFPPPPSIVATPDFKCNSSWLASFHRKPQTMSSSNARGSALPDPPGTCFQAPALHAPRFA